MIERKSYIWYYCLTWLFFHLIRIDDGLCMTCLDQPFLYELRQDPLLWLGQYFDLPRSLISYKWVSLFFDVTPAILIFVFMFHSDAEHKRLWLLFIITFWIYLLIILSFPSLSVRKYLGLALIPIAFIVPKNKYDLSLEYLRYFCLFIFSSSALWKIFRGSIFESDHFYNIIRSQHFSNFLHYPDHWISNFNLFLLDHPNFLHLSFVLVVLAQLSFAVGVFTRRYDKVLFILMIAFILMDFVVMRIEYWEFAVFFPLLWKYDESDEKDTLIA